MKTSEIEIALAKHFNYRRNIIIPNVFWGMGLNHEVDLLLISTSNYCYEYEIKVSKSDLKHDAEKRKWNVHYHYGKAKNLIKGFSYAVPEKLVKTCLRLYPEAGCLGVSFDGYKYNVKVYKQPKIDKSARKITNEEKLHLEHLGCMRLWKLKDKLNKLKAEIKKK